MTWNSVLKLEMVEFRSGVFRLSLLSREVYCGIVYLSLLLIIFCDYLSSYDLQCCSNSVIIIIIIIIICCPFVKWTYNK